MSEKRCENDSHAWLCRQEEGQQGEIVKKISLTPDQVKLVSTDPRQADVICPGGAIVCGQCGAPFPHTHSEGPKAINFSDLQEKLIRSVRH